MGYVLHRNKANLNMMPTYQRIIKRNRLKSVHKFVDDKKGYFPNSIIISIDSGNKNDLEFKKANTQSDSSISKIGLLYLPKKYRSAFIIDGQHRLYGYANSIYKTSNSIPVVAFLNLNRTEQVKLFMQINENQKAVSKNLRNTLNADLLWTSDNYTEQLTALRSRIAIFLGESRNSALYDKISIGEDNKIITQQAFENALKKCNFLGKVSKNRIERLGSFYNGDLDECYNRLSELLRFTFNYFKNCVPNLWDDPNSIIVINKGIYAIIKIQSDIIDHLLHKEIISKTHKPKVIFDESKTYLDSLIIFFQDMDEETEKNLRKAYGTAGDTKYWRTLQQVIQDDHPEFSPSGLEEYRKKEEKEYNTKTFEYVREIETFFKEDFKEKLINEFGGGWLKKGVPPSTLKKAHDLAFEKNMQIEDEDNEVENWDCLTIIAYRSIALKNWRPIFEKEYSRLEEGKKSGNKEDKTKWMVHLEKIRNKTVHDYYVSEEEFSFVENIYDWLIKNRN
ncbi:DGQHR domain-containing protein [Mesonia maritima]|uniref:DGQHR domain-containing protein n=1 Tax=Mesonia maritima TaxID=1793873 RepID=UPI0036285DAF